EPPVFQNRNWSSPSHLHCPKSISRHLPSACLDSNGPSLVDAQILKHSETTSRTQRPDLLQKFPFLVPPCSYDPNKLSHREHSSPTPSIFSLPDLCDHF
ncbi:mCG1026785, partial [Mus musculus]